MKALAGKIWRIAVVAIREEIASVGLDTMICRKEVLGEADRSRQATIEGMVFKGIPKKRMSGSSRLSITEVSR